MKYNIDADGVAYLTMAEQVAKGHFDRGINGLWSPINAWLIAPCIALGFSAWYAALSLNAVLGILNIVAFSFLTQKANLSNNYRLAIHLAFACMLSVWCYFQVFGDILQLVFVLLYLTLLLPIKQLSIKKIILASILMSLAYYAKSYNLYFYCIQLLLVLFFSLTKKYITAHQFIRYFLVAILCTGLCVLPYSFAMQKKYHQFSLSGFAGALNFSWQINSHKTFHDSIQLLIPPPYSDSPAFWEDPMLSKGTLDSPFTSTTHFFRWLARVTYTSIQTVIALFEISFFSLVLFLFYFFYRKEKIFSDTIHILMLTCLVLPLGYILVHIETRYVWLLSPLLLLVGSLLLMHTMPKPKIVLPIFLATFLISPFFNLIFLWNKNKELFEYAQTIRNSSIRGNFTSNAIDDGNMFVIAYLTKNRYFSIEKTPIPIDELKAEMLKYKVPYYYEMQTDSIIGIDRDVSYKLKAHFNGLSIYELVDLGKLN
ncbi:MAG: hypothetical protein R2831_12235 [Chitinophagaceae bacterium]